MEGLLQGLANMTPPEIIQWIIVAVAFLLAVSYIFTHRSNMRLTDAKNEQDTMMGLLVGAILGALTGVLWATWNPIMIVPPYIHLRVFSFFIPVIGILFGRGAGFVAGYVATMIWAPMAGAFVPLHSPIADGIMVGMTGWVPAYILRGGKSNAQLLDEIQSNFRSWWVRSGIACLFAGLLMSAVVALSFAALNILPFWLSFWAIGVVSDTGPMVLFTGPVVYLLLTATKRSWSWMPQF